MQNICSKILDKDRKNRMKYGERVSGKDLKNTPVKTSRRKYFTKHIKYQINKNYNKTKGRILLNRMSRAVNIADTLCMIADDSKKRSKDKGQNELSKYTVICSM